MRRIAFAAVFAVTLVMLQPGQPAAAAAEPMTIVNSASFVPNPVSIGALLTAFTDRVVSQDDTARAFSPWVYSAPGGLAIYATCAGAVMPLPILYVGRAFAGNQVNFYFPGSTENEPFGTCATAGPSHLWIQPAAGRGLPIETDIMTVQAHPGVFFVGAGVPSGTHIDGLTGEPTPLSQCSDRLPADPTACRVRNLGEPAVLVVDLTGAALFRCSPCGASGLIVELAPVLNGVLGAYLPQYLGSLVSASTGIERATVYLRTDLPGGEYRLRVRFNGQPVIAPALTIELGKPA